VGGLLAVVGYGVSTNFVACDGNGNVAALLQTDGSALTAQYEYGPFGELLRTTGPMARNNPFRFSTKYQDDESDLLYYGYRYYNPSTGRWPSRDPMGEIERLNLYLAVRNSALTIIDFIGLYELKFDGNDWNEKQEGLVKTAFNSLKEQMPRVLKSIEDGLKLANGLPDCCAYKKPLLNALNHIQQNTKKVKDGLDGNSAVTLSLDSFDPQTAAEVRPSWVFYYPQHIYFNTGADSSYNYFLFDNETAAEKLFHELTHFSSTGDTDDKSVGLDFWNNGPFYESLIKNDLNLWGKILLNEIKRKTKQEGCPTTNWPDQKSEPKKSK